MGFEAPREGLNGTSHRLADRTLRWSEPIGVPLEDLRRRLLEIAEHLKVHLDDHALPLLVEATRLMRERMCRIAVIGQIKAGKSTFINALVQRPNLLPTDINPWTAVVTLLHFRNDSPPPEHTAVFHLFSADEWKTLAEGGGKLRELTERLVPEFQPELLRAQLEVMRQRAERRLGPSFHDLLGQRHCYNEMTPELLSDYISAGDYDDARKDAHRKLYSDITRTAELYFNDGPFSFPVTVIDTPGTNDPFLVRDEITRRTLENPDIYIFVISALQPLSASDISMLRLLNGLHKERIIVFINRTDQLGDPAAEVPRIKADVHQRLKREFPALDIPIVTGSGWWANLSLQPQTVDLGAFLRPSSAAALRAAGLPAHIDVTARNALPQDRALVAKALHAGSGLPEISAHITAFMGGGGGALLLRQLASCFLEFARSAEVSSRMEGGLIVDLLDTHRFKTHTIGSSIQRERESLASLAGRAHQLRQCFDQVDVQLKEIIAGSTDRLRSDLHGVVEDFAAEACQEMVGSMQKKKLWRSWICDVMPLRERLETEYVDSFRDITRELVEIERALQPQLRALVDTLLPGYGSKLEEHTAPEFEPYPSVAPLSDTVVLDLDISLWRLWFASRPDPHARAEQLSQLITDDFFPLVDELVREAQAQLANRIGRSVHSGTAIGEGLLQTIETRSAELLTEYEALHSHTTQKTFEQFQAEQEAKAVVCSERQGASAAIAAELEQLVKMFETALATDGTKP